MKSQRTLAPILALTAAVLTLGAGSAANAQSVPVYIGPGAPPPFEPPRYVRAEPLPDDLLLPQEIIGILRSTGFSPLSAPVLRGRFYIVAALHPDGQDGQVTMDAVSGRFVRFVPAGLTGRSMASYPAPPYAVARRGLRPPLPVPGIATRAPTSTPVPMARPPSASQANAQTANAASGDPAVPAHAPAAKTVESKTASAGADAAAKSSDPVEVKPSFGKPAGGPALRPMGSMPPAQGFE
jgi:hypothetical protein